MRAKCGQNVDEIHRNGRNQYKMIEMRAKCGRNPVEVNGVDERWTKCGLNLSEMDEIQFKIA